MLLHFKYLQHGIRFFLRIISEGLFNRISEFSSYVVMFFVFFLLVVIAIATLIMTKYLKEQKRKIMVYKVLLKLMPSNELLRMKEQFDNYRFASSL